MERKAIVGYEGIYEASNNGDIFNIVRGQCKLLKQTISNGYCVVNLRKDGKQRKHRVHRLVAIAFIDNKSNCDQINHIDGNKENNAISNLEWCTQEHNTRHYLNLNKEKIYCMSKKIIGISMYSSSTIKLKSIRESSRYGFDIKAVRNCCEKRKDHHKGYKWSYING